MTGRDWPWLAVTDRDWPWLAVAIVTQGVHCVALCCGLLYFVWMLVPDLGAITLASHLNWALAVVNS